ncbi:MAG: choice-of-anchor Q domain-containing protein [Actinomycetota bacterium]
MVATVLGPASPAGAATISVTTTADELNSDGDCSLREAIVAANTDAAQDQCTPGSGPDTIAIPAGTYTLSLGPPGDSNAMNGDLDIRSDVTLDPNGKVVIDGGGLDRVFEVGTSNVLTASDLSIRGGNAVGMQAAAIGNGGGTVNLTGVLLVGNKADNGGGAILTEDTGSVNLTNVTISGNETGQSGGGLQIAGVGTTATLNNVSIVENVADSEGDGNGDGGGIWVVGATVNLVNTIVAANYDRSPGNAVNHPDCSGPVTSQGYNLIGETNGCTITGTATGNVLNQNPQLEPLRDNGGSTETHALKQQSPAVDAGNPAAPGSSGTACAPTDQRGVARPQGPRCDIGGFELQQQPPPPGVAPKCLGKKVTITGSDAPDTILGTKKADVISSLGGDDVIVGLGAGDRICAGDGNDRVKGRSGDDQVLGQAGNDRVRSGGGGDTVKGGAGNDRLRGQRGDDILKGGGGNDRINGGGGFDLCRGGPGPDRVRRCET